MKVEFRKTFEKDLRKLREKTLLHKIRDTIEAWNQLRRSMKSLMSKSSKAKMATFGFA